MIKASYLLLLFLLINALLVFAQKNNLPELPKSCYNLVLQAPINSWDEAIPLGNGLMGGLLWGENNTIRLSLDRGDLWDERINGGEEWWKEHTYQKGVELVAQKKYDLINNWWDGPYNGVTPTKLPAGRVEIKLPVSDIVKNFELTLSSAEGVARFNSNTVIRAIYIANEPVALLSIKGIIPDSINLLSTMDVYRKNNLGVIGLSSGGSIANWVTPKPRKASQRKRNGIFSKPQED